MFGLICFCECIYRCGLLPFCLYFCTGIDAEYADGKGTKREAEEWQTQCAASTHDERMDRTKEK